jgi:hypothetical protein
MDNQEPAVENLDPGAGTAAPAWYASLDGDYNQHPSIQKFSDANGLAKSYLSLEKMMGQDKIVMPKEETDVEGWNSLYGRLGVPETAEGYGLVQPEGVPEGLQDAQMDVKAFAEIAKGLNLTPKQAKGLQTEYADMITGIYNTSEAGKATEMENAKAELTNEWGLAYNEKINLAQNVLTQFAGDKAEFDYINAKIGNDPKAVKMLAKIGAQFSEGSLGDFKPSGSFTKTPAEAKGEYDAIMNDTSDPYWSGDQSRVDYVMSLLKMQHPDGQM